MAAPQDDEPTEDTDPADLDAIAVAAFTGHPDVEFVHELEEPDGNAPHGSNTEEEMS